jgi:Tol biopolymer transport system component
MLCKNRILPLITFCAATAAALGGCAAPKVTGENVVLAEVTQLTRGFDRAGEAYFSPDLTWIIFQATPPGEKDYQMYLAPLDAPAMKTGRPIRISPVPSKNTCGFFSPDGRSVIFASTAGKEPAPATTPATKPTTTSGYQRSSGTYRWEFPREMEIFRADGWDDVLKAADPLKGTNLARHPLTDNLAYDAECAFSPDGKWIVFASDRDGDVELYVMQADGSNVTRLTHTQGYDGGPFFSPDGKRLVYRSDRQGNDLLQIFVADVVRDRSTGRITGLKRERQLTKDQHVNWGPYWHPDGKHIIYATSVHGHQNYELYLMRPDGSRKTRITFAEGFDGLPVFSPDGKYLMWSSKRSPDNTTQIFVAKFTPPAGW